MIKPQEFEMNARIVSSGRLVDLMNLKEDLFHINRGTWGGLFPTQYQRRVQRLIPIVDKHIDWLFNKKYPKHSLLGYERYRGAWLFYPWKARERAWWDMSKLRKSWRTR